MYKQKISSSNLRLYISKYSNSISIYSDLSVLSTLRRGIVMYTVNYVSEGCTFSIENLSKDNADYFEKLYARHCGIVSVEYVEV